MRNENTLRLGSRGSALALTQTEWVAKELWKKKPDLAIQIIPITTQGDRDSHPYQRDIAVKGIFVKELEEALLGDRIDVAVHSMKDMPQRLPDELSLGPVPLREDPREALISSTGVGLRDVAAGTVIGTSSPRRIAFLKRQFRDRVRIQSLRGNVDTRLKKMDNGLYGAIVLAYAGIKRLGLESRVTEVLEPSQMMPAPGQGCLGLEVRTKDTAVVEMLDLIRDDASDKTARAERAFLTALGGDCFIPVGALAKVSGQTIYLESVILDPEGRTLIKAQGSGPVTNPDLVGSTTAKRLLNEGGADLMMMFRHETPGNKGGPPLPPKRPASGSHEGKTFD